MGMDICISDDSLMACDQAPCAALRRETTSYNLPDDQAFLGWKTVTTLSADLRSFEFTNQPADLTTTPTESRWACAYRSLNGDETQDQTGASFRIVTPKTRYEFIEFLTREEFQNRAIDATQHSRESAWSQSRVLPDRVEVDYSVRAAVCKTCQIKPEGFEDCQPRLLGAGSMMPFIQNLDVIVRDLLETPADSIGAFSSLLDSLDLGSPELDEKYRQTIGFYNKAIDHFSGSLFTRLIRRFKQQATPIHQTTQRLFAALFLHDDPFTQSDLDRMILVLDQLRTHAREHHPELIRDPNDAELLGEVLNLYHRTISMARKHKLEISISY
ncbi:MAG: hypothetical protein H6818_09210 [Phycisphaerales bacterium]|nr:hypothetical protein [Phycisphaerales bacterium]